MALAEYLFARLSTDSAVVALVGAGEACRIYPNIAPPGVQLPYAVMQQISAQPGQTHNEPSGATFRTVQYSCFGATAATASALRDAIVAALDGQPLDDGEVPMLEDERNGFESAVDLHRADADFRI